MTDVAKIAFTLGAHEAYFLTAVCEGLPLRLANRVEDRARQKVRRCGLVAYCGKPRRWQATELGLAVRTHLKGPTHEQE